MDAIEKRICELIDQHSDEIIEIGRDIWYHAELGFKEFRTAEKTAEFLRSFGLETETGLAVTGVKSWLKEKKSGEINLALVGEMDALPIPEHVDANPETGASHCCVHNAQMAGMLGSVFALTDPTVKEALGGNVVFLAAPAEEFNSPEERDELRKEEKIRYDGGKCELIRIGAFDDIDITVGHHCGMDVEVEYSNIICNGFVMKTVKFTGKAAHSAGHPDRGLDALAAAELAMHAVDLQRETFRDKDSVRMHGFISRGGTASNIIADDVRMEYSIRANNVPAMKNASEKFDRAMRAAAKATGCGVTINTMPGYLPKVPVKDLEAVDRAAKIVSEDDGYSYRYIGPEQHQGTMSTDFGDVANIMPVLQIHTGGALGECHSPDVRMTDEKLAYVTTAKFFAMTAYELLRDGARCAKRLKEGFKPPMTKAEYIGFKESLVSSETIAPSPIEPLESDF